MKNLIVVYKEKSEEIIDYLKMMIESNDDNLEKGVIVGTADNTVKIYAWDEKTWLKKKITMRKELQGDRILFLGNIQGIEKIKPSLDIKFDKHGVMCGLIDNLAVILVNPRALDAITSYEVFLKELKSVCNSPIVKRKPVFNDEKKVITDSLILVALSIAFPVTGLATTLTTYTLNAFNDEKTVKKQQMLYGVVRLYREYLNNFMDGNPSILTELNEVIKENKALRGCICNLLTEIGLQKISCYDKELRIFLSLYKQMQSKSVGKKIIESLSEQLSVDDKKRIEYGINKINEITDKTNIADKDAIPWSLFGTRAILKHVYSEGDKELNRTLMYLTYPLFEVDKKYLKNEAMVFNGKVVDELLFASEGFPVTKNIEVSYKNGIKNEEYRQSLYLRFKDFNKILEKTIQELEDFLKEIKSVKTKLSNINDSMERIVKIENGSNYAIRLSSEIVSEGNCTVKDLFKLVDDCLFDNNGKFSTELQNIKQKKTIQMVAIEKAFDELELYFNKYEDVKEIREDGLSDLNIKIVYSKEYNVEARYYQYYRDQEGKEWVEIYESSPLRYDDKFRNISKDNMTELITQLCNATTLGASNTSSSIFFVGDQQIYSDVKLYVENQFNNVNVFYIK